MSRFTINRRGLLGAGAAFGLTALAGCGGGSGSSGSDDGVARLRALNLSADVASIDLLGDDDRWFEAVARGAASDYRSVDDDTYSVAVRAAGESTALLTGGYSFDGDSRYTAVVWGRRTATRLSALSENDDDGDIDDGQARTRVFNATLDAGSVDVYLTASDAALDTASAQHAGTASGSIGAFRDIAAGTWRLRITGAGDPADVRLDVPELVLTEEKHHTIVVAASGGGVLVDAVLLPRAGEPVVCTNGQARLRVVAGADAAGLVAVTLAGSTLVGGLRSPSVGAYASVAAGTAEFAVSVDGVAVATQTVALAAGTDSTLLVWGADGARQVALLADDNRLPTSSTRLKMRLVHAAGGADAATLSVDYLAVASDIAVGAASAYASLASSDAAQLDVTVASASAAVFSQSEVALQAGSVYSVFLLGGNDAPTGVLRRER